MSGGIKKLVVFKENYPDLHVVAAGSLPEFALNEMPSYGVGRVRSVFMYPMSFKEYLMARGKDMWVEEIMAADCTNPIEESLHSRLVSEFRSFLMVGGMLKQVFPLGLRLRIILPVRTNRTTSSRDIMMTLPNMQKS